MTFLSCSHNYYWKMTIFSQEEGYKIQFDQPSDQSHSEDIENLVKSSFENLPSPLFPLSPHLSGFCVISKTPTSNQKLVEIMTKIAKRCHHIFLCCAEMTLYDELQEIHLAADPIGPLEKTIRIQLLWQEQKECHLPIASQLLPKTVCVITRKGKNLHWEFDPCFEKEGKRLLRKRVYPSYSTQMQILRTVNFSIRAKVSLLIPQGVLSKVISSACAFLNNGYKWACEPTYSQEITVTINGEPIPVSKAHAPPYASEDLKGKFLTYEGSVLFAAENSRKFIDQCIENLRKRRWVLENEDSTSVNDNESSEPSSHSALSNPIEGFFD